MDFDCLITELCPIDSLIQRLGRMGRHDDKGTARENGFVSKAYYYEPENCKPYKKEVLDKTKEVLKETISVPSDIRSLIEAVYTDSKVVKALTDIVNTAKADSKLGADPTKVYRNSNEHKPVHAITRFSEYPVYDIMVLNHEDMETIKTGEIDREWFIDRIQSRSVKVYKYDLEKLGKGFYRDKLPKIIKHSQFVDGTDSFIFEEGIGRFDKDYDDTFIIG